jgi:hypothetical protein
MALYIRDRAALEPQGGMRLPPLQPLVPAAHPALATNRDAVSQQWSAWWDVLVSSTVTLFDTANPVPQRQSAAQALDRDDDTFPELHTSPGLQRLAREFYPEADGWVRLHRRIPALGDLTVENKVAKRVQRWHLASPTPFSYCVVEIPLSSSGAWPLAPNAAIVASSLRARSDPYSDWLYPVIAQLAYRHH